MTEQDVMDIISDYVETLKDDTTERLKFINTMIDYFMFHKRFSELKPHELIAFGKAIDGGELNDYERDKLNTLTTEEAKDNYIGQIARTNYFRKCAWLSYLHGEANSDKPYVPEPVDHIPMTEFHGDTCIVCGKTHTEHYK